MRVLRHNSFQTVDASHRTGQRLRTDRTSYSVALEELRPQSETGNYTGAWYLCQARRPYWFILDQPLYEIHNSGNYAANNGQ